MNVPEAVVAIQKLAQEMQESSDRASIAATRYDAHMGLYNAAVMSGDNKTAEQERLAIHSQVDAILDAGFEIYSRKLQIMSIQKSVSD